ncbi:hypothetical protein EJ05DRAFT_175809 [Pseudovirgaria hyperparasitica]|uniref:Uncharacterized protein n=1 Tax=Pseudovirgaria hyperparasitica TaxID=470096 RepID=A0A6A6WHG9_9PEZI|nr:uncharacterized protein EJ05DRAFT_175809 [Pseudovirgaria hyperparasitica]KAF2761535.1 hypothetical protein EJ05DRAFT_175809 [Pseudovirgaria hyperparasitica]
MLLLYPNATHWITIDDCRMEHSTSIPNDNTKWKTKPCYDSSMYLKPTSKTTDIHTSHPQQKATPLHSCNGHSQPPRPQHLTRHRRWPLLLSTARPLPASRHPEAQLLPKPPDQHRSPDPSDTPTTALLLESHGLLPQEQVHPVGQPVRRRACALPRRPEPDRRARRRAVPARGDKLPDVCAGRRDAAGQPAVLCRERGVVF